MADNKGQRTCTNVASATSAAVAAPSSSFAVSGSLLAAFNLFTSASAAAAAFAATAFAATAFAT